MPKYIEYNKVQLTDCLKGHCQFEIYQSDTIIVLNRNGYKEGLWIDFYETGEIMKRKTYKNGAFKVRCINRHPNTARCLLHKKVSKS